MAPGSAVRLALKPEPASTAVEGATMRAARRAVGDLGVTLVLVALVIVVILTFVAIVVDLGNARQERRHMQNAVDASALAAAVLYTGQPNAGGDLPPWTTADMLDAKHEGLLYLRANDVPAPPTAAAENEYACEGGQDCTVTFTFIPGCIQIRVDGFRVDTSFAPVIGAARVDVGANANGCVRPGEPGGLVPPFFVGGECASSGKAFVYSGNRNIHVGRVHSNWDVKLNGTGNQFQGQRTYVEDPLDDPAGQWAANAWGPAAEKVGAQPWPPITADLTVAALGPTSSFAMSLGVTTAPATADRFYYDLRGHDIKHDTVGTLVGGTYQVPAGVYFTDKKIEFGSKVAIVAKGGREGATFISSGGLISISGNNSVFRGFEDAPHRLAFFTAWNEDPGDDNKNCDSETFQMSGRCVHIDGLVYAPAGKIRWSGDGNGQGYNPAGGFSCPNGNPDFIGAFVGWAFEFSGNNNLTNAGVEDLTPTDPVVYLGA